MKTTDEKSFLSVDQAKTLLAVLDDDRVHTFRQSSGMILGADWKLESLLEAMEKNVDTLELAGGTARRMDHGIAFTDDSGLLFIATLTEKLDLFDPPLTPSNQ